jgi:hypothetical protein
MRFSEQKTAWSSRSSKCTGANRSAAGVLVDGTDLVRQVLVGQRPLRRRSTPPGVEAAAGNLQHTAHRDDAVVGLLCVHEPEQLYRFRSVSRAKKALAFRRICFSSSRTFTRRRRRKSSSRSSVVRPSLRRP